MSKNENFNVGRVVTYNGDQYFVISYYQGLVEIAPTKHGAGSFYVADSFVTFA